MDATFNDLENAFQYFTAPEEDALDFFVSNNLKDFQKVSPQPPMINPGNYARLQESIVLMRSSRGPLDFKH